MGTPWIGIDFYEYQTAGHLRTSSNQTEFSQWLTPSFSSSLISKVDRQATGSCGFWLIWIQAQKTIKIP
jgi:hypothetical protein